MQAAFANANTPQEKAMAAVQAPLIAGKATLRTVGAVVGAISKPLFGHVIPMMKNGAFRENMGEWLRRHDKMQMRQTKNKLLQR